MGLLGQGWDDPQSSANMALAAGLLHGNLGAGFAGAGQAYADARNNALKQQLVKAQMDNFASEIEARKLKTVQDQRQQSMIEGMFPGLLGGSPSTGAPPMAGAPAMGGAPQMPPPAGPGAAPGAMPAPAQTMGAQPNDNDILALSQRLGIPPAAIKTDMVFNGGKGIAEMLYKRGIPDMQVTNGYAYDKNRVGPGFMPGVNIANDGRGTMTLPGADGIPRMSAMPGSVEAYGSFEDRKNASASGQELVKAVGPDGAERYVTKAQAVSAAQPPRQQMPPVAPQPGVNGGFTGSPDQISAQIDGIKDPQERANARAAFEEQARRTPGFGQGAPFQASPTNNQRGSQNFSERMAGIQAEALDKSRTGARTAADDLLGIQQARQALQSGVFAGSGAEAKLSIAKFINANVPGIQIEPDKVANTDYLKSTLGRGLLEQAKTLGSNPSNADASRINDIVGSIGKDPGALAKILDWRQEMALRSITLHNTSVDQAESGGYKSQFDMHVKSPIGDKQSGPAKQSFDAKPIANSSNKGKLLTDTTTGQKWRSNGITWVEEK